MPRSSQARVTVFAIAGAVAGVVPVPVLPRKIVGALRGAMAHDICAQYGLALTADAREVLADPSAPGEIPAVARDAIVYFAGRLVRRLSPYATVVQPARTAFETLAFGRLLDRYLERHRGQGPNAGIVRIDAEEARRLRKLLDRAAVRAIMPGLARTHAMTADPPEDYRSSLQRALDGALLGAAGLPEVFGSRLDAAMDDVVAVEGHG